MQGGQQAAHRRGQRARYLNPYHELKICFVLCLRIIIPGFSGCLQIPTGFRYILFSSCCMWPLCGHGMYKSCSPPPGCDQLMRLPYLPLPICPCEIKTSKTKRKDKHMNRHLLRALASRPSPLLPHPHPAPRFSFRAIPVLCSILAFRSTLVLRVIPTLLPPPGISFHYAFFSPRYHESNDFS
jgi:hypothetical protein